MNTGCLQSTSQTIALAYGNSVRFASCAGCGASGSAGGPHSASSSDWARVWASEWAAMMCTNHIRNCVGVTIADSIVTSSSTHNGSTMHKNVKIRIHSLRFDFILVCVYNFIMMGVRTKLFAAIGIECAAIGREQFAHEASNQTAAVAASARVFSVAVGRACRGERVAREETLENAPVVLLAAAHLVFARVQVPLARKPALGNVRRPKPTAISERNCRARDSTRLLF